MIALMPEDLFRRHRITVEEYYRMAEFGLLAPETRVELIAGEVIDMAPIGERHQGVVDRLAELLILAAAKRVTVRQQGPVRFDRNTELQTPRSGSSTSFAAHSTPSIHQARKATLAVR